MLVKRLINEPDGLRGKLRRLLTGLDKSGPESVWKYLEQNIHDYNSILLDWTWLVSGDLRLLSPREKIDLSSANVLLGPNIHFEDQAIAEVVRMWDSRKIIVPSEWVADVFEKSRLEVRENLIIWASTVDSNYWKPEKKNRKHVLIYIKDFSKEDFLLDSLIKALTVHDREILIVRYGEYSAQEFKNKLNASEYAVWLGGTESQGLALLEAWFMNVPTLVLERNSWTDRDGHRHPSSSAPYLTSHCGHFFNEDIPINESLENFFEKLPYFTPRRWALDHFSHSEVLGNLVRAIAQ